jgi:hypothetical protein
MSCSWAPEEVFEHELVAIELSAVSAGSAGSASTYQTLPGLP